MSSIDEIKTRLKKNWYQFVNANSKKFTNKIIDGSSPPSLFVGEYGYPHVRVGPMVPPYHGDTSILDKPELWLGKSMEEILYYRINLLKGTMIHDVNNISGRYIESLQDMALSKSAVESTMTFEKIPSQFLNEMILSKNNPAEIPVVFSAPVSEFKIQQMLDENVSVNASTRRSTVGSGNAPTPSQAYGVDVRYRFQFE